MSKIPKKKKLDTWLELDYINMDISKTEIRVWFEDGSSKEYKETRGYRLTRYASYAVIPVALALFFTIDYLINQ